MVLYYVYYGIKYSCLNQTKSGGLVSLTTLFEETQFHLTWRNHLVLLYFIEGNIPAFSKAFGFGWLFD